MGIALCRMPFEEWATRWPRSVQDRFFRRFKSKTGIDLTHLDGQKDDQSYLKLGSYTRYGVFILCLTYLTDGDFESQLEADEDIELEALYSFRFTLRPASSKIHSVEHFLESGDTDTIFIPKKFSSPISYRESWVASLPAAIVALEDFANQLGFCLSDPKETEEYEGKWNAVATSRNIARDLHGFFVNTKGNCVAYC